MILYSGRSLSFGKIVLALQYYVSGVNFGNHNVLEAAPRRFGHGFDNGGPYLSYSSVPVV